MCSFKCMSLGLAGLLCGLAAYGQSSFNPDSPSEPGVPPVPLVLQAVPSDGGRLSGGGRHVPGESVRVSASANSGFVFECWTDTEGKLLSSSSSFNFVKGTKPDTLVAHFTYSPGSPSEPSDPSIVQYFTLSVVAGTGGTVSGGGRYQAGQSVRLSANCQTNFEFVQWTDAKGTVVSTQKDFTYTTKAESETLTAQFRFNPSAPSEPSDPVLSHNLYYEATEGGTVSGASRCREGESTYISAYPNTGYKFVRWWKDGEPYTELPSFSYTMEKADVHFRAEFVYRPGSPSEPSTPEDLKYAFYLMSVVGMPGTTVDYPVYMSTLDELRDMTFQLTFPVDLVPDMESVEMSPKAEGYTVSAVATSDTSYVFTLTGGRLSPGNARMFQFKVRVPETFPAGQSRQVKINQVSVTEPDGNHLTASTRNGRIYVFDQGDTNGDGVVNVSDKMNLITHVIEEETETFIPEVSDMNGDGAYDVSDAMGVIEVVLEDENINK